MSMDYPEEFTARFETSSEQPYTKAKIRGIHEVVSDEPEWLPFGGGEDAYPAPVDYMVSSLAFCQISVLQQCLEKARIEEFSIEVETHAEFTESDVPEEMPPNTANRVDHITVDVWVEVPTEDEPRARRCVEVYDLGCVVGQSFKAGIEYTPNVTLGTRD